MSAHTCRPRGDYATEPILVDDCERCAEHAKELGLLTLDHTKITALYDRMLEVERANGYYRSDTEAEACRQLYRWAIFTERHLGIDPWKPLP